MVGIPYANWNKALTHKVCPVCDAEFTEGADEVGEDTTHNYADHYTAAHGEQDYRGFYVVAFDTPNASYIDRYRVVLSCADETWAITVGPTGNHPQGVCLSTERIEMDPQEGEVRIEDLSSLPVPVQRAIENEKRIHAQHVAQYG